MRKQEYIQLHALFVEASQYYEQQDLLTADELNEYENLGVRPTSIHKSKTDHKEAIQALTPTLADISRDARPTDSDTETESRQTPKTRT